MCGIFCTIGPNAVAITKTGLEKLRHRGPDQQNIWSKEALTLGFTRLAINGLQSKQEIIHQHKHLVGVFNAEVYNHRELAHDLGQASGYGADTQVILPLFEKYGAQMINQIDGFYSGVIFDAEAGRMFWCKDVVGKKPLFFAKNADHLFLTSETKALPKVLDLEPLPVGFGEIDLMTQSVRMLCSHSVTNLETDQRGWMQLFENAVRKRLQNNETKRAGIFLSGGIDSSIIAMLAEKFKDDIEILYYSLGNADSQDHPYVQTLLDYLKIAPERHRFIPLPQGKALKSIIEAVVCDTESYNPSIVSNGIGTWLLSQAAQTDDLKVVLTGDGADEVFLGYWGNLRPSDDWQGKRRLVLETLHMTEMRRVDMTSMAHSIEIRCPFLDRALLSKAQTLDYNDLYCQQDGKLICKKLLRDLFSHILPDEIVRRSKLPFDRGSGLQKCVWQLCTENGCTEKDFLKEIWIENFQHSLEDFMDYDWFRSYPAFDDDIDKRGRRYSCHTAQ